MERKGNRPAFVATTIAKESSQTPWILRCGARPSWRRVWRRGAGSPQATFHRAPIPGANSKQRETWDILHNLVLRGCENTGHKTEVVESISEELYGDGALPLARSAATVAGFFGLFGHL